MKKKNVVLIALLLVFVSPFTHIDAAEQKVSYYFTDLKKTHWAAPSIMKLVNKGYMQGYADGSFQPNRITTRAEAASVIAKTMGISLKSTFTLQALDVPTTHPHYAEIRKLAELGIIENNDYFHPNEPLKRAHISKMIALAYHIVVDAKNKSIFKDYPTSYWAKNYIESLADVGIVNGTTKTAFSPNRYVTRAHLAGLTIRGMEFRQKLVTYQVAYDYLSKHYIETINTKEKWTEDVISFVNEERAKKTLKPLKQDEALNQLAIIKAQDMIKRQYFDHKSPYYGHPWDMATLFDYSYTSFGENIAFNFTSPKEVVTAWMSSEKHRENILKSNYTNIGIGIKSDAKGKYYWVQLFSSN